MLWFRNLIFYRFEPPAGLTQEHLEQALGHTRSPPVAVRR